MASKTLCRVIAGAGAGAVRRTTALAATLLLATALLSTGAAHAAVASPPLPLVRAHHPLTTPIIGDHECSDSITGQVRGQVDLTVKNARPHHKGKLKARAIFDAPLAPGDYRAVLYLITVQTYPWGTQLTCDTAEDKAVHSNGHRHSVTISTRLKRGTYEMQFALFDAEYNSLNLTTTAFTTVVERRHC